MRDHCAVFPQNICDGAPGYGIAEIREGAANACIPPVPSIYSSARTKLD